MKGDSRSLLRKFCLDGSILGLKYFYLFPDKSSRCFWLAFIVFLLYFAMFLAYKLYCRFEAMPTRITIENQFEPIAPLPFPAITVCSPNQMTLNGVRHFDETLVNGNRSNLDLSLVLPQLLAFYHFVKFDLNELARLQTLIELNRYTVPEVLALLPQSCEAFMRRCVFRLRLYPRCAGLFHPILTRHGLCCIFNSPYYYKTNNRNERDPHFRPQLVGDSTGARQGLTVVLDFDPADSVDHTIHLSGSTRVMFTDWLEFPADDESLLVAAGTESFHIIRATATYCSEDVRHLTPDNRKCSFENEKRLPFFWQYRNSDCDMLCLVRAVEDRCQCQLFYVPHLRSTKTCDVTRVACIMDAKLNLNEWLENEECECPRDCDSRQYATEVSIGDNFRAVPDTTNTRLVAGLKLNRSSSIMHFFFHTSVYEKQKQETVMSLTTLASNLGGVFGLCVGCSVISLVEIWFYCYSAAKNTLRRRLVLRRQRNIRRRFRAYYE